MKLLWLTIVLILTGCSKQADTSNAAATGKPKDTTPQTQSSHKAKWDKEPSSFIGIVLDQPLKSSVPEKCKSLGSKESPGFCYSLAYLKDEGMIAVDGVQHIPPLYPLAHIRTLDGTLDGGVGHIKVNYTSSDFPQVMEMLTIKYGPPHTKEVKKLQSNGGATFDSTSLSWVGENVIIETDSLVERRFSELLGAITERGEINVYTVKFLAQKSRLTSIAAQKGAAGL